MMQKFIKSRVLRFIVCGGTSALVEFMVFLSLKELASTYASALISFLCGLVVSFLLNKLLVFKNDSKKKRVAKEVGKFLLLGIINSQLSSWMTVGLVVILGSNLTAKIITMLVIATWNYFIMKYLIFKPDKK